MRLLAVLAVGLALVSAGCFGGDEEPTDDTTPTPVTGTPPTATTPAAPTNGTGTGGGNGTGTGGSTPAKTPTEVFNDPAADFASAGTPGVPPGTGPHVQTKTFPVGAGFTKLTLNVTWTATGPAVVQNGVSIKILGPDGTAIATCPGPAAGPAAPAPCTQEGPITAAGDYTAQYEGSGNLKAAVVVIAS